MPGLVDKQDYDLDDNSLEGRQVDKNSNWPCQCIDHASGSIEADIAPPLGLPIDIIPTSR